MINEEKIETNSWDIIDDFIQVLQEMKSGKWNWYKNSRCKYVNLQVSMRDCACIIRDRNGNRISPKELAYQYELPK